jgi:hypothetical protein
MNFSLPIVERKIPPNQPPFLPPVPVVSMDIYGQVQGGRGEAAPVFLVLVNP